VTHPSRRLDDDVHQRTRLGILVVLHELERADFNHLRAVLELTAGNLSRNLSRLKQAGLITVEKTTEGNRPRTWLSITDAGRAALQAEIAALREIVGHVSAPAPSPVPAPAPAPSPAPRRLRAAADPA
jgi:DNA-binding MarR family transcriptional regulator